MQEKYEAYHCSACGVLVVAVDDPAFDFIRVVCPGCGTLVCTGLHGGEAVMLDVMLELDIPRVTYVFYPGGDWGHNVIELDNDLINCVELGMRVREDCLRWS